MGGGEEIQFIPQSVVTCSISTKHIFKEWGKKLLEAIWKPVVRSVRLDQMRARKTNILITFTKPLR